MNLLENESKGITLIRKTISSLDNPPNVRITIGIEDTPLRFSSYKREHNKEIIDFIDSVLKKYKTEIDKLTKEFETL